MPAVPAYFVRIVTTNDGPLVEHNIQYVAVPQPIPVAAGFEDTFAFFNGQLNSGDLPIFVILRSNNDDIKIGVVTAVPKVVAKSYVCDLISLYYYSNHFTHDRDSNASPGHTRFNY